MFDKMQSIKRFNKPIIYTIGHSNIEFEKFLNLLAGIDVLVDVRSVPYSKYVPQFNLKNIKKGLENAGIEYLFMEDEFVGNLFGGRPKDEECYENEKLIYERVIEKAWYKEGISALIELAKSKSVVIMCSEEDPHKCHRHYLITQSLLRRGVAVFHIRGNGSKEKVEKPEKLQLTLGSFEDAVEAAT